MRFKRIENGEIVSLGYYGGLQTALNISLPYLISTHKEINKKQLCCFYFRQFLKMFNVDFHLIFLSLSEWVHIGLFFKSLEEYLFHGTLQSMYCSKHTIQRNERVRTLLPYLSNHTAFLFSCLSVASILINFRLLSFTLQELSFFFLITYILSFSPSFTSSPLYIIYIFPAF